MRYNVQKTKEIVAKEGRKMFKYSISVTIDTNVLDAAKNVIKEQYLSKATVKAE